MHKLCAYTTRVLDAVQSAVDYSAWNDFLTGYNGKTITSDTIGNMLSDGTWTYTWEHGRELMTIGEHNTDNCSIICEGLENRIFSKIPTRNLCDFVWA